MILTIHVSKYRSPHLLQRRLPMSATDPLISESQLDEYLAPIRDALAGLFAALAPQGATMVTTSPGGEVHPRFGTGTLGRIADTLEILAGQRQAQPPAILIQKLQPDAVLPRKAHKSDAGWDI